MGFPSDLHQLQEGRKGLEDGRGLQGTWLCAMPPTAHPKLHPAFSNNMGSRKGKVQGRLLVVHRGDCRFSDKFLRGCNAGASAVVVVNKVTSAAGASGGSPSAAGARGRTSSLSASPSISPVGAEQDAIFPMSGTISWQYLGRSEADDGEKNGDGAAGGDAGVRGHGEREEVAGQQSNGAPSPTITTTTEDGMRRNDLGVDTAGVAVPCVMISARVYRSLIAQAPRRVRLRPFSVAKGDLERASDVGLGHVLRSCAACGDAHLMGQVLRHVHGPFATQWEAQERAMDAMYATAPYASGSPTSQRHPQQHRRGPSPVAPQRLGFGVAGGADGRQKRMSVTGRRQAATERIINGRDSDRGCSALHFAVESGALDCIEHLLDDPYCLTDLPKNDGYTPLHMAIENGATLVAKLLVEAGADVNHPHPLGWTALHFVAKKGLEDLAHTLVQAGAAINARAVDGCTPLHVACLFGQAAIVQILIDVGALVHLRTCSGREALDLAVSKNHHACVQAVLRARTDGRSPGTRAPSTSAPPGPVAQDMGAPSAAAGAAGAGPTTTAQSAGSSPTAAVAQQPSPPPPPAAVAAVPGVLIAHTSPQTPPPIPGQVSAKHLDYLFQFPIGLAIHPQGLSAQARRAITEAAKIVGHASHARERGVTAAWAVIPRDVVPAMVEHNVLQVYDLNGMWRVSQAAAISAENDALAGIVDIHFGWSSDEDENADANAGNVESAPNRESGTAPARSATRDGIGGAGSLPRPPPNIKHAVSVQSQASTEPASESSEGELSDASAHNGEAALPGTATPDAAMAALERTSLDTMPEQNRDSEPESPGIFAKAADRLPTVAAEAFARISSTFAEFDPLLPSAPAYPGKTASATSMISTISVASGISAASASSSSSSSFSSSSSSTSVPASTRYATTTASSSLQSAQTGRLAGRGRQHPRSLGPHEIPYSSIRDSSAPMVLHMEDDLDAKHQWFAQKMHPIQIRTQDQFRHQHHHHHHHHHLHHNRRQQQQQQQQKQHQQRLENEGQSDADGEDERKSLSESEAGDEDTATCVDEHAEEDAQTAMLFHFSRALSRIGPPDDLHRATDVALVCLPSHMRMALWSCYFAAHEQQPLVGPGEQEPRQQDAQEAGSGAAEKPVHAVENPPGYGRCALSVQERAHSLNEDLSRGKFSQYRYGADRDAMYKVVTGWISSVQTHEFKQGLLSLAAPILSAFPNQHDVAAAYLGRMTDTYGAGYFDLDGTMDAFGLLAQQMQAVLMYWDPMLASRLLEMDLVPELYAIPWMCTLFADVLTLSDALLVMDVLVALPKPNSFLAFIATCVVMERREDLLRSASMEDTLLIVAQLNNGEEPINGALVICRALYMWSRTPSLISRAPLLHKQLEQRRIGRRKAAGASTTAAVAVAESAEPALHPRASNPPLPHPDWVSAALRVVLPPTDIAAQAVGCVSIPAILQRCQRTGERVVFVNFGQPDVVQQERVAQFVHTTANELRDNERRMFLKRHHHRIDRHQHGRLAREAGNGSAASSASSSAPSTAPTSTQATARPVSEPRGGRSTAASPVGSPAGSSTGKGSGVWHTVLPCAIQRMRGFVFFAERFSQQKIFHSEAEADVTNWPWPRQVLDVHAPECGSCSGGGGRNGEGSSENDEVARSASPSTSAEAVRFSLTNDVEVQTCVRPIVPSPLAQSVPEGAHVVLVPQYTLPPAVAVSEAIRLAHIAGMASALPDEADIQEEWTALSRPEQEVALLLWAIWESAIRFARALVIAGVPRVSISIPEDALLA